MRTRGGVAVLGDFGGQFRVMMRVLEELGVSGVTLRMPKDLVIVQLGDLVRVSGSKELDSLSCVKAADRLMEANPGQWIQIIGNHDAALIGGPRRPSWRQAQDDSAQDIEAASIIQGWWRSGKCQMAHSLATREYGSVLLTHGGLTRKRWMALGSLAEPRLVADRLNVDVSGSPSRVFAAGSLGDPDESDGNPDVTWAEVNGELYEPWIACGDMPFTQIHGHASPWNWQSNDWWPSTSHVIRSSTSVHPGNRRTVTRAQSGKGADHRVFVCTDWNLGETAVETVWPTLSLTECLPGVP